MSISLQITGNIVRSDTGTLDLVTEFSSRADASSLVDLSLNLGAEASHEVTGIETVSTLAIIPEEGSIRVDITTALGSFSLTISKFLLLSGLAATSVEIVNLSDSEAAKVRVVAGG